MIVGEAKVTNMILRMLGTDIRNEIDNYINEVRSRDFMVMNSVNQIRNIFSESLDEFLSCLTEEDLMDLRSYTGYNFRNINAILRGNWSYEINGELTQENKKEYRMLADKIGILLSKFNIPKIDFVTFRGVTLNSFSDYGIREISQLDGLEGKFLYEQGFTSTSMLEDTSYFNKNLDNGENCNVEIRYLIPAESNDGALLIDYNTSYSVIQNEFVLNKGALSKVINVKVDKETNTAVLTVILVPKKIYDMDRNVSKNK